MMKVIFYCFLFYAIYRFVFNVVVPVSKASSQIKSTLKEMQAQQAAASAGAAGTDAKPQDDNVVDAEVKEVKKGMECGLNINNFNDIKVGDVIEGYKQVEVQREL